MTRATRRKYLDWVDVVNAAAKGIGKPILHLSVSVETEIPEQLHPAVPYLDYEGLSGLWSSGQLDIVCSDMEEAWKMFNLTVGDDGPTLTNKYDAEARVYAYLVDGAGNGITENT